MSWDADLIADDGEELGEWNYTHNCNGMIAEAIKAATGDEVAQAGGPLGPAIGPAWWKTLDGMSGPDGAAFLDRIITGLMADPVRFEAMNPENGWGSYESLLRVLSEMRDSVPERPCRWETSG